MSMEIWDKGKEYSSGDVVVVPDKENPDLAIEYKGHVASNHRL